MQLRVRDRRRQVVSARELDERVLELRARGTAGVPRVDERLEALGGGVAGLAGEQLGEVREAERVGEPGVPHETPELPVAEARRHIEHRAGGAGYRDAELLGDVAAGQAGGAVDGDARTAPVGFRGDLERRRPVLDVLPEAGGRSVAEDGAGAAG